jgi:hypothetical protein
MKNITLLILLLMFSSCSKDYFFNKNQENISKELKDIANADQAVRNYDNLVNRKYNIREFITVCDSLYKAGVRGNYNQKFDFSTIPSEQEQIMKFNKEIQDEFYSEKKKGLTMMKYIDNVNKEKIYSIIKKYGYPSFYNRKWKDTVNVRTGITSVLTHYNYNTTDEKKLLKLMIKEYFKGRVQEGEMKHFLWSADDRPEGGPSKYNIKIDDLKKRLNSN